MNSYKPGIVYPSVWEWKFTFFTPTGERRHSSLHYESAASAKTAMRKVVAKLNRAMEEGWTVADV